MGSGADWVRAFVKVEPSPLGERVADLLDVVWQGIYHIEPRALRAVGWTNPEWLQLIYDQGQLATWDFNHLSGLVVLGHDARIRVCVAPSSPRTIRVYFHARARLGGITDSHPTLEVAAAEWRAAATARGAHFWELPDLLVRQPAEEERPA